MSTNKKKFLKLVAEENSTAIAKTTERIENRPWLKESQEIALKILEKLGEIGLTQRQLAQRLGVSPQQVTKFVSGKENMTLATQKKLQEILDIPILATYYEQKLAAKGVSFKTVLNINTSDADLFIADYLSNGVKMQEKSSVLKGTFTDSLKIA